jgi:hypothetical protein
MVRFLQIEEFGDRLFEPPGENEGEKGGGDVLAVLDRADGLAGDAGQTGEILLGEPFFGPGHAEAVGKLHKRLLKSLPDM